MKCFSLLLAVVFFMGASPLRIKSVTQNGGRTSYYLALRSGDLTKIDSELKALNSASGSHSTALEGALLMRKAGLLNNAGEKLELFKSGRTKLENALARDKMNSELHFLRLIVQENAPKMLKYDDNITEDAAFLRFQYNNQDPALQKEILSYSKTSAALKKLEFHE
jgi:hypothetical protein